MATTRKAPTRKALTIFQIARQGKAARKPASKPPKKLPIELQGVDSYGGRLVLTLKNHRTGKIYRQEVFLPSAYDAPGPLPVYNQLCKSVAHLERIVRGRHSHKLSMAQEERQRRQIVS